MAQHIQIKQSKTTNIIDMMLITCATFTLSEFCASSSPNGLLLGGLSCASVVEVASDTIPLFGESTTATRTPSSVGDGVVGFLVGLRVGVSVGYFVGDELGFCEGKVVGTLVGFSVGSFDGDVLGLNDGNNVGSSVGSLVGLFVGGELGFDVGRAVGLSVGDDDGFTVGIDVGSNVGSKVGAFVGVDVDLFVVADGTVVGSVVGSSDIVWPN